LAIRLAFIRWRIWGKGTLALLIAFYISFFAFFIYLDQFYQKPKNTSQNNTSTATPSQSSSSNSATPSAKSQEKVFTISELAKYDGQNGNLAYVAVDGVVYDVSSVFTSGSHFSHYAGQELTDAFYTEHAKSSITKYPVVGRLE
jgi:predicted heme/steroid binding protein